ncbi:MAG: thiamine-phosphate kinase [Gammaproteobacteria bacterium]|nr:MAG: thiamine-phosphate kinase [Gammaproteobacteria bacterium]
MPGEFEIIDRCFRTGFPSRADVVLGIGDDAACLVPPAGRELVAATDTLVAGIHFPPDLDPGDVGYRALAVNLSDLAAMGAEPAWMTLALTLPEADLGWLTGFAAGLRAAARGAGVALVGGDTTRGPLTVTIQVLGTVPAGTVVRRAGARPGEGIYVSGTLGDAAMGLACLRHGLEAGPAGDFCRRRFARPEPRLALGQALRGRASAMIDVSDGLLADLGHLLAASGVGATLARERVPVSEAFRACLSRLPPQVQPEARTYPLSGGDDYELCFTLPPGADDQVRALGERCGVRLTHIGVVESHPGLRVVDREGRPVEVQKPGYEHFGATDEA